MNGEAFNFLVNILIDLINILYKSILIKNHFNNQIIYINLTAKVNYILRELE